VRQATSVQDEAETAVTRLRAAGYCILDRLLPTELIAALRDDLSERFEKTPFCQGDFYGQSTKRFGSLLIRSPHTSSLVQHPLVLDIAQRILGSYCDRFQLNLTQAVEIHPGAPAQPQHRDQDMWGGAKGEIEYLLNVIWPLTPFTARNGATIVWPHSHRCQQDYMLATNDAIAAEMDPGAALFFLGSTLHAGGANNAHLPRSGVIVSYSLGWLKPFESQFLVYPPDVARHFTPELAALVGYAIHRPNLSNYEGQCPSVLLKGTQTEFLPARDALRPEHNAFIAELRRAHSRFDAR
jgi:ectoine hydroxylase-related dioxygenase (phytanoyl-CoA dioxygenase family)